jgi:acyl-CoA thioesterase
VVTPSEAEQRARQMYDEDVATRSLGIELLEVGVGSATVRMTVAPQMLQGHGTCHGGYLFLLADTAFAFACNTRGPAVAGGADVEFLAPVHAGDELVATAVERVVRGRRGVYDVTVLRGQEPVAEFRGRSRSVPGPTP